MRPLIHELIGAVLGALLSLDNLRYAIKPDRFDDPIAAEKKRLTRSWVLTFLFAVGVSLVAFVLDDVLGTNGTSIAAKKAFEPLQTGLLVAAAAALAISALSMAYFGYRLWKLERAE